MTATALKVVTDGIRRAIPAGTATVSSWAEQNRWVERGARKGKWSNKVVPFAVEIMDAFTDPDIREVVFMKSAQVAGSEILANVVGYYIEVEPTEIAYVAEKEDKTRAWMVESFDSMVRATPSLSRLVKTADEDNNQRVKRFPGGQFFGFWATSPAELSSRPIQIILFDEKPAYKPTHEGDAVKLGVARTKTYSGFEKIGIVGTPRHSGDSADIEADFLRGDKRQFWVPCPSCDGLQLLRWGGPTATFGLKWDNGDPETAYYLCEHCAVMIENSDLNDMLWTAHITPGMGWIKDADLREPFWPDHIADPKVASFRINQIYSPLMNDLNWSSMATEFLEAKRKGPGSPQMQTWTNTALGEPWRPYEKIDYGDLTLNREDYKAEVPDGVLVLTAGVDVQGNRLEYEVVGWGRDNESWSIEIGVLDGDPGQNEVWEDLADKLSRTFAGTEQDFRVQCAFIDSGYHAQQVYKFAKKYEGRKWYACKGLGDASKPITSKATWVEIKIPGYRNRVRMIPVGTTAAKDEIFSNLKVTEFGPGYCHFPDRDEYDEAYLKQLCSEKKIPRIRNGLIYYVYDKISPNIRNEALDLRVYATAARVKFNPKYDILARQRLKHPEVADRPPVDIETDESTDPPRPRPRKVLPFRGSLTKNNPFRGYKP